MIVLETQRLSRFYGEFCALAPASFSSPEGEIIVISGQNGAGKSTLLLCLAGLLRPTSGSIQISGYDLYQDEVEAKKRSAFVPDVPRFYTELTAWEHLKFIALAHKVDKGYEDRATAILTELGLWEARDLFPHNYSRGMQLKLGLAMAFIRPFQILILDEPTSALDLQSVDYLREKLLKLRLQGSTVVMTTHNLNLLSDLNARHWKMSQGKLEEDA
jgi:ABC-2 type transport system ATP-binding protein